MHPLYTNQEFKAAKSRDKLPLQCKECLKTFHRSKRDIQSMANQNQLRSGDFCSQKCNNAFNHKPIIVPCSQCGTPCKKLQNQIQKSKSGNVFCNRSCSTIWRNLHKKHGTRRSKLEKWLEEQLTILYPDLEIHFNRKDAIQSELDIYIPSLRLAFELNGIYHYEPIHGQDKLNAVQSNDKRKFAACHEAGIGLCSIDTSHQKYFKVKSSQKFLGIIAGIIDTRLSDLASLPAVPD